MYCTTLLRAFQFFSANAASGDCFDLATRSFFASGKIGVAGGDCSCDCGGDVDGVSSKNDCFYFVL